MGGPNIVDDQEDIIGHGPGLHTREKGHLIEGDNSLGQIAGIGHLALGQTDPVATGTGCRMWWGLNFCGNHLNGP